MTWFEEIESCRECSTDFATNFSTGYKHAKYLIRRPPMTPVKETCLARKSSRTPPLSNQWRVPPLGDERLRRSRCLKGTYAYAIRQGGAHVHFPVPMKLSYGEVSRVPPAGVLIVAKKFIETPWGTLRTLWTLYKSVRGNVKPCVALYTVADNECAFCS